MRMADDSHEILRFIFYEKINLNVSSAAAVIGTLRVEPVHFTAR